jgi:ankyrin repeat protein
VREGNEKLVRELVAAGAKLDRVYSFGYSALHVASSSGHVRIVKLLLDGKYKGKGAAINVQTRYGYLALNLACSYGHKAVARLLLERGADVTLRDSSGRTALSEALFHNRATIVALLEARGARE